MERGGVADDVAKGQLVGPQGGEGGVDGGVGDGLVVLLGGDPGKGVPGVEGAGLDAGRPIALIVGGDAQETIFHFRNGEAVFVPAIGLSDLDQQLPGERPDSPNDRVDAPLIAVEKPSKTMTRDSQRGSSSSIH